MIINPLNKKNHIFYLSCFYLSSIDSHSNLYHKWITHEYVLTRYVSTHTHTHRTMLESYFVECHNVVMGFTPHSDTSRITILNKVNEVHGLQIKKDGMWVPIKVSSDALVVNVGDILEVCHDPLSHFTLEKCCWYWFFKLDTQWERQIQGNGC